MTNTTAAEVTTTTEKIVRCACGEFEIGHTTAEGDEQPEFRGTGTGCISTTRRVFAPGHDARLKSLLIKAGVAGMEVRWGSITSDAVNAAQQFGFAPMVADGIERGLRKAAAPRKTPRSKGTKKPADERAAALTAKMAEVAGKVTVVTEDAPAPQVAEPVADAPADTVQVKVGRWEYAATIIDGDAHFIDAKGVAKVALEGNYRRA